MLSIIGVVAIIVIAVQVYKTASSTERNAVGWTALALVIGIGIQFVVPVVLGFGIGLYLVATGTSAEELQDYMGLWVTISVAAIVLSLVGMILVAKHVSKVKDEVTNVQAPPPPPDFGSTR